MRTVKTFYESLAMLQLMRARERLAKKRTTTLHSEHGLRAMARRRRQIAAGSLRVENGLVA